MAAEPKSQPAASNRRHKWLEYAAVFAILAWYYISSVSAVVNKSTTFDELFHLTAGYSYWTLGDFRIHPENGNLPQRWAAIPLLFSDVRFPELDQSDWRSSSMDAIGRQFFYEIGNDVGAILLRGRAMMALFGVALGALIFFWMRRLLGVGPALASVVLFAFCPTMLANGALITSDMAAALLFTASMLCIWRVLHQLSWQAVLVSSLVLGCLFVSKFSAVLVAPMGLILMAIQLASHQPTLIAFRGKKWVVESRLYRLLIHAAAVMIHVIVVWIVIWAFYNFRYEMFAATKSEPDESGKSVVVDKPVVPWNALIDGAGLVPRTVSWMRDHRILPEAYLYGFAHTWRFSQARSSFFNGSYGIHGWRQFFPYCLLVKTPLTLFLLITLSLAYSAREWYLIGTSKRARGTALLSSLYRTAPLWVLWTVYWAVAIQSHLNIGHRHIVPTYPPMLALAGGAWMWLSKRPIADQTRLRSSAPLHAFQYVRSWIGSLRWPILACTVLFSIALFCAESLSRWPNYLAYFNQVVGGPRYAYRHLIDSSLDWGQDLPALKRWLADPANDASDRKTYLSYFGTGSPTYYGITFTPLPCYFDFNPPHTPEQLEAGIYCISATMLQNVYSKFPGPWNVEYENKYQELESEVRAYFVRSPIGRNRLIGEKGVDYWLQLLHAYEHARFARLMSFLRQREPDAQINFSILIYRLDAEELDRALKGPPVETKETPAGRGSPAD